VSQAARSDPTLDAFVKSTMLRLLREDKPFREEIRGLLGSSSDLLDSTADTSSILRDIADDVKQLRMKLCDAGASMRSVATRYPADEAETQFTTSAPYKEINGAEMDRLVHELEEDLQLGSGNARVRQPRDEFDLEFPNGVIR
jgi:hypothetical protein